MKTVFAMCLLATAAVAVPSQYGGGGYGDSSQSSYGNNQKASAQSYSGPNQSYKSPPVSYRAPSFTFSPPQIHYSQPMITFSQPSHVPVATGSSAYGDNNYRQPVIIGYQPQQQSGYSSGGYSSGGYSSGGYKR